MGKRIRQQEEGSVLILVTFLLLIFLAAAALIIDVGFTVIRNQQLQYALDSGALAGAWEMANNSGSVVTAAEEYLLENIAEADSYSISTTAGGVNIWGRKAVGFFLAPLFGNDETAVEAAAAARVSGIMAMKGAAPLAVEEHNFVFGQPYVLKQAPTGFSFESYLGSGNFGALSLGGSGASRYEENLKQGFPQLLSVGDIVATETGNISGATRRGIGYRLSQCSHYPECTPESFEAGCKRILWIPVYRTLAEVDNQVKEIEVVGFAAFFVSEVAGSGVNNEVRGYFVKTVTAGIGSETAPDYGLKTLRLVREDAS